eukprot:17049_1
MEEYNEFIATDTSNDVNTVAVRYNVSTKNNALCLDGTNGVFYFRPGFGEGITKYQLFLEGGGGCSTIDACNSRSETYKGSTINDTKYAWYSSEFLMSNQQYNPLTYNWNTVFLRYCDGASFSGNNNSQTVVNNGTKQLYFRGFHILTNSLQQIWNDLGLNVATDVILSGCSAGGEGTYYHADYVRDNFVPSNASFMAIPESGFFLASANQQGGGAFDLHNMTIAMNQECIKHYEMQNESYLCGSAQYTMPYIKSKAFALQSKFDAIQIYSIKYNIAEVNELGNDVVEQVMNQYINGGDYHMNHGAFFDSCSHHCGEFNHIQIDGYLSSQAMYEWYHNGEKNHSRLYMQDAPNGALYPCDSCCFLPNTKPNGPMCVDSHN